MSEHDDIQEQVRARLAERLPEVDVLLAEVRGGTSALVVIDHPDGVSLDLCERVSGELGELRERFALEVSSPGTERPLVRPEHFRRYVGRRARVRTRQALPAPDGAGEQRTFTGELVGADERAVTLATPTGVASVAYADIHRSNLIEE